MQIDRKRIEQSLGKKGFVHSDTKHKYFYHEFNGKRTGPFTFTSHGSSYKTYDISLIKRMKTSLQLETIGQTVDLLTCPMSAAQYIDILQGRGVIPK